MDYYTFEIDGTQVGYFEMENKEGLLYQNAFVALEGERFENPFWVRHAEGAILAYRFGEEEEVRFTHPADVIPSSALCLFVSQVSQEQPFAFRLLNEGTGQIVGPATMQRAGNVVQVHLGDQLGNRFVEDGEGFTEIGWGGTTVSRLVTDKRAAVANTVWA